jgi:hypothetical protein
MRIYFLQRDPKGYCIVSSLPDSYVPDPQKTIDNWRRSYRGCSFAWVPASCVKKTIDAQALHDVDRGISNPWPLAFPKDQQ